MANLATAHASDRRSFPVGGLTGPGRTKVVQIEPASFDKLKPHWRGLADRALTPNPFMSPEFIEPAAVHLAGRNELALAAVFRQHSRSEELIGLFAVRPQLPASLSFGRSGRPSLWSHPWMTDATPLLSADRDDARDAVQAIFGAFGTIQRGGLTIPSIAAGSAALEVIGEAAAARGMTVRLSPQDTHSRGLHIVIDRPAPFDGIAVAREPATLVAMLEQALAMDAAAAGPSALHDLKTISFLRAAVRGFSHTRQAVMARIDDGKQRAAALAWLSPDRALIWRLFGPHGRRPSMELALARAIGNATGRRPAAASFEPVAGFGMEPHATVTATIGRVH
jgi:hypothetical protein